MGQLFAIEPIFDYVAHSQFVHEPTFENVSNMSKFLKVRSSVNSHGKLRSELTFENVSFQICQDRKFRRAAQARQNSQKSACY